MCAPGTPHPVPPKARALRELPQPPGLTTFFLGLPRGRLPLFLFCTSLSCSLEKTTVKDNVYGEEKNHLGELRQAGGGQRTSLQLPAASDGPHGVPHPKPAPFPIFCHFSGTRGSGKGKALPPALLSLALVMPLLCWVSLLSVGKAKAIPGSSGSPLLCWAPPTPPAPPAGMFQATVLFKWDEL